MLYKLIILSLKQKMTNYEFTAIKTIEPCPSELHKGFPNVVYLPRSPTSNIILECKTMLKRREECNTYLTHVYRHHWSRESPVKRCNIRSFQPALWLSSAVDID